MRQKIPAVLILMVGLLSFHEGIPATPESKSPQLPTLQRMLLFTHDISQLARFYQDALAFSETSKSDSVHILKNRSLYLEIRSLGRQNWVDRIGDLSGDEPCHFNLNMLVPDLNRARVAVVGANGRILDEDADSSAVGDYLVALDPDGNEIHLIVPSFPVKDFDAPRVYNIGLKTGDMESSLRFYCDLLGFEVYSEEYYPPTMPLLSEVVMLVLHEQPCVALPGANTGLMPVICVEMNDPDLFTKQLNKSETQVTVINDRITRGSIVVQDPNGAIVEILPQ